MIFRTSSWHQHWNLVYPFYVTSSMHKNYQNINNFSMLLLTIPSFYWKVPFGQHWIMIYVILPCHRFEILYAFLPYCPFYLEELSFKLTIKPPFSFDGVVLSASALLREWYCIFLPIMPFHSTNLFQAIPFLFSPVIGILSCLIFMSIMSELESIMTCPFSFSKFVQVFIPGWDTSLWQFRCP